MEVSRQKALCENLYIFLLKNVIGSVTELIIKGPV